LTDYLKPEKPPAVLADRTRELLRTLELFDHEANDARGFRTSQDALDWARDQSTEKRWYAATSHGLPWFRFWYRQRDDVLSAPGGYGYTNFENPPLDSPGEVRVELDHKARLLRLDVIPDPDGFEPRNATPTFDWTVLLDAAGIDPACLEPVEPRSIPRVYADELFAWSGNCEDFRNGTLRVEAASLAGNPVLFVVEDPWSAAPEEDENEADEDDTESLLFDVLKLVLFVGFMVAGGLLARRNVRTGRSDLRGANRLVAIYVALHTVSILPMLELSLEALTGQIVQMLSNAGFQAALLWIAYLALEPIVRRRWPAVLVSWSRLLQGKALDPRVGRDVLIGCLAGASLFILNNLNWWVQNWSGGEPLPVGAVLPPFLMKSVLGPFLSILHFPLHILEMSMVLLLVFVLLSMLLRKTWLALTVNSLLWGLGALAGEAPPVAVVVTMLAGLIWIMVVLRVGFLAGAVSNIVMFMMFATANSADFGEWYGYGTLVLLITYCLIVAFSFRIALGGRPMFGSASSQ
jgi:hypothetical protein